MTTPKNKRRLDAAIAVLFGARGFFVPKTIKGFEGIDFLRRELRLSSGNTTYFSDAGMEHLRVIVDVLEADRPPDGLVERDDIYFACREVVAKLLGAGLQPDDGKEFMALAEEKLFEQVKNFTFVVPMSGLSLDGIDAIPLGELRLLKPSADILADCVTSPDLLDSAMKQMKRDIWLVGTERGTSSVARRKYLDKARRVAGLLSLAAGSCMKWGATSFLIVPVMAAEQNFRSAVWLSFPDDSRMLSIHHNYGDSHQSLKISVDFLKMLEKGDWFPRLVELINREPSNEVEEALIRAIYWFSDAQRDPVREMQLVKFWSCIECFFSFEGEGTTAKVIKGLAAVMVAGGYEFVSVADHAELKRRINERYEQRSVAVHDARYGHVTQRDVADLSKWAAWLIINVMALAHRGYTTRGRLLAESLHMDWALCRGRAVPCKATAPVRRDSA